MPFGGGLGRGSGTLHIDAAGTVESAGPLFYADGADEQVELCPEKMSPMMMRLTARTALSRASGATLARARAAIPQQQQLRYLSAGRYVDQMRSAWKSDPSSVHESWNSYFSKEQPSMSTGAVARKEMDGPCTNPALQEVAADHVKMLLLVRSYQARGHYMCNLDPLGINSANLHVDKFVYRGSAEQANSVPKFLDYKTYGFTEKDLDRSFFLNANVGGTQAGQGGLVGSGAPMKAKNSH